MGTTGRGRLAPPAVRRRLEREASEAALRSWQRTQGAMKCFLCNKVLPPALVRKLEQNGYTNGLCRECSQQIKKG